MCNKGIFIYWCEFHHLDNPSINIHLLICLAQYGVSQISNLAFDVILLWEIHPHKSTIVYLSLFYFNTVLYKFPFMCSSQTCMKRSPLRQNKRWPYETGDLLIEVQFIWNFPWQDKKRWPLNTGDCLIEIFWQDKKRWSLNKGDCLIEVTAWVGLIVLYNEQYLQS
jgi:hypothetical protein